MAENKRKKKKAPAGDGNLRERKDGRWEGRYTAGYDPKTGKQIVKSVYGKNQQEARAALRQITMAIDNGTYIQPSSQTVAEWCNIWYNDYLGNTTIHTHKSYRSIIDHHITPVLGNIKLQSLDVHTVQRFINRLKSSKPNGGPLSPKTVKNIHGVLHAALDQAKRLGYISKNPADDTVLPHRLKPDISVMDDDQIERFLSIIKGHQYEYLYIVTLFSGLRQSEVLGLSWDDINFNAGTLTVRRQLQYLGKHHGGYVFREATKNGKSRIIAPGDLVMSSLLQQKQHQDKLAKKLKGCWTNTHNLVFTTELGDHLKHDHVYRSIKRLFCELEVPEMRFHDLRHSFAVLSLRSGDDIKTVQENLGHYSASFTLDTYGHVTLAMMRNSAKRRDAYIQSHILNETNTVS